MYEEAHKAPPKNAARSPARRSAVVVRDIVVTPRLTIPAGELAIAFARSGGPGGQNVNKVSSKVELRWNPRTSVALADDDRAWLLDAARAAG